MSHPAGPEADGADANAVDSVATEGVAAEDAAAEDAAADNTAGSVTPDAPMADTAAAQNEVEQAEADRATGEPADHEVAVAASEPASLKTGEPRVDAALTLLDRLAELPVTEHAAVFELVHAELTAVLGQLDPESAGADD